MSEPRRDTEHVHEWFEDTSGGEWCYGCGVTRDRLAGTSSDTPDNGAGTPPVVPSTVTGWLDSIIEHADEFGADEVRVHVHMLRLARELLDAARSRPATDPAGLDALRKYGWHVMEQDERHQVTWACPAMTPDTPGPCDPIRCGFDATPARLSVADGPGPEERLREAVQNLLDKPVFDGDEGFEPTLTKVSAGHLAALRAALSRPLPENREEPSR